jgi:hypothetical protein
VRAVIVLEKFLRTCTGEIWCLFFLYGNFNGRIGVIDGVFVGDC